MNRIHTLLLILFMSGQSMAQTGLNFDGVNDYVNCGMDPLTDITGTAITLEAWIYPTSFQPNIWQGTVISRNDISQSGYMLRVGGQGQVNFNFGSFGAWNELNTGINAVTLNTWQHVAATYDGSVSRIYVNGVEVVSAPYTGSIATANQPLFLGEDPQWTGRFFPGSVDEVRIWNVTRSAAEVNADMNNELCTTDPNLVVYYRFNEGVAGGNNLGQTSISDESGNGLNGTLINFAGSGATSNWTTGAVLGAGMLNTVVPVDACETYTWPVNGQTYTASGFYAELLTAQNGCDSTVTLDLNIVSPPDLTSNQVACDSFTWGVNGQTYTTSTTVVENLTTPQGCPYDHTLNLTINQSSTMTESIDACDSYTWPVDGQTYTISGTYTSTFTAQNGCDSIQELNLTILPSLTADIAGNPDGTLSTTHTGVVEWYDCDNDAVIAGENGTTFTPTANGNYAVIVSDGLSCPDTSACITVDYVGLEDLEANGIFIQVEPNPTTGNITVFVPELIDAAAIHIVDTKGRVIQSVEAKGGESIELALDVLPGVYLVNTLTEYGWVTERIVKM